MILTIETSDPKAIETLTELAKELNVTFSIQEDVHTVSAEEVQRRMNTLLLFKGILKPYFSGYQPEKHEWYQQ
ncbi:MAG TPA: hypothetical protein PLC89_13580 [Haliscomenobacter sp.]|uniref:hypothetical protein n=1 Tax=Haliscomenobacter sp. TaxID=2717303 RepID=UPI002BE7EEA2|nr:hypothetical protein [Haliscomenobacter sp.]HOY18330.1 hypothetical protein [Haliscomenobacter sp.]